MFSGMASSTEHSIFGRFRSPRVAGLTIAAVTLLWIGAVLVSNPWGSAGPKPNEQTTVFHPMPSRAEALVSTVDGAHFAQLAVDPLYRHTLDNYEGNTVRAGYRALRPMQGWVDWAASLGGHRDLLAPAMILVAAVFLGLLPLAVDAVSRALRRSTTAPILILALPGVISNITSPGTAEPLATVVVLAGLACWLRDRRAAAVALFCVAALTRETTLAIPAGIALAELVTGSTGRGLIARLRRVLPLTLPLLTYLGWSALMAVRVAPLDHTTAEDNGFDPTGLIRAIPHWGPPEYLAAAGVVASIVIVLRRREPILTGIVVTHLVLMAGMGVPVWGFWWAFGRVILPLNVLAFVGPKLAVGRETAGAERTDAQTDTAGTGPTEPARERPTPALARSGLALEAQQRP